MMFVSTSVAETFVGMDEISLDIPESWIVETEAIYPFSIVSDDGTAELIVARAVLAGDERVGNPDQLKQAVDLVISDVILPLPESQLLSSTGQIEGNHALFSLDFLSVDVQTQVQIRHRLVGELYLHPNGHQLLFSLWGRAASDRWDLFEYDLMSMQESFAYLKPAESNLFAIDSPFRLNHYLIGLAVLMLLWLVTRRLLIAEKRRRINRE
jgi:hypothetical protein